MAQPVHLMLPSKLIVKHWPMTENGHLLRQNKDLGIQISNPVTILVQELLHYFCQCIYDRKLLQLTLELVFPIPAIPKPVFRYSGLFNTGQYRQNFAGIRTYKMDTFDQNYYLLKNILSNVHLIYFVFTLANWLLF
jgi:hypothetical protein